MQVVTPLAPARRSRAAKVYARKCMHEEPDNLARIDESGTTRPVGATAALRMQARAGAYHVLPAPPHMLLLQQTTGA